jgi:acetyltransferase
VPDIIRAAACGTRAAIVISAGLGDGDPDGPALRPALVKAAQRTGVRFVGPNCLGLIARRSR